MPFDGNGNFNRTFDWTEDAASGIKIRADRHDAEMDDYAQALSKCVIVDGQSNIVADIPMNGHRFVDLGAPINLTDAATKKYVDDHKMWEAGLDLGKALRFFDDSVPPIRIASIVPYDPEATAPNEPPRLDLRVYDETGNTVVNKATLWAEGLEIENGALVTFSGGSEPYLRSSFVLPDDDAEKTAILTIWDADANPPTPATKLQRVTFGSSGIRLRDGNLIFEKDDGTIRGRVVGIHDSSAASIKLEAYNTSGVKGAYVEAAANNCGSFSINGAHQVGGEDGVARGSIAADPLLSNAASALALKAIDKTGAIVGSAVIDSAGIRPVIGDFYLSVSGVTRLKLMYDAAFGGGVWKSYDGAGTLLNGFGLTHMGTTIWSPAGSVAAYRGINNANGIVRGSVGFNSDGGANALAWLLCSDNAGARQQRLEIDSAGGRLLDGAAAGDILTTGNFPSKNNNQGDTNFVVGTTLLFDCPSGSEMNRNQAVTMRFHPSNSIGYRHTGAGTALDGTWRSCGLVTTTPIIGMARRVA